jgi:glycine oxidase
MNTISDVVVVGGGVIGCAAAWRLAQAGARVTVLERAIPGAEASSAAAGILAAQEEAERPGALADLCLASRARFPALAAELRDATGLDIGYRETGVVAVAFDDAEADALERRYGWQRGAGLRVDWLRGAALREAEPGLTAEARAGLSFPDDGQLEPKSYLRALAVAAARAGVTFRSGAYVRRIVEGGVEVEGERLAAGTVVVAAGSWSALIEGGALPPTAVRPVRGQILEVETRPPLVRGTITCAGGYVIGRADGRVLCGSTMEQVGFEKRVTAGGLRHVLDVALKLIPSLAEATALDSWANFRPATGDGMPILGFARPGLLLATGHFRNGILLSAVTADLVRDLVTRGTSDLDLAPFSPARLA